MKFIAACLLTLALFLGGTAMVVIGLFVSSDGLQIGGFCMAIVALPSFGLTASLWSDIEEPERIQ